MQNEVEKLLGEVTYHKGEVMNDPQSWSETDVYGGGHMKGSGQVSISSSSTTWTTLMLKKESGKEYMAKLPYAFPARKGHTVIAADFRGSTIAAANDVTDHVGGTTNVVIKHLNGNPYEASGGEKLFAGTIFTICLIGMFVGLFVFMASVAAGVAVELVMFLGVYFSNKFLKGKENLKKDVDAKLPIAVQSKLKEMLSA